MEPWKLIRSKSVPVSEGLEYAQNVRIRTIGECQRRHGLSIASTASGAKSIGGFFFPSEGYGALLFTSTGTVEKLAL